MTEKEKWKDYMTEKEKWYELGYAVEIKSAEQRRDPMFRSPRHIKKSELNCFYDCVKLACLEADWNWYNYWPLSKLNGFEEPRTPEEVKLDIRTGKCIEFLFALQHKDEIKTMPTIYSLKHNEFYDMIFKNGDKYEVKTSKAQAEAYKEKHPDVVVAYPVDSINLNADSEFIILR